MLAWCISMVASSVHGVGLAFYFADAPMNHRLSFFYENTWESVWTESYFPFSYLAIYIAKIVVFWKWNIRDICAFWRTKHRFLSTIDWKRNGISRNIRLELYKNVSRFIFWCQKTNEIVTTWNDVQSFAKDWHIFEVLSTHKMSQSLAKDCIMCVYWMKSPRELE